TQLLWARVRARRSRSQRPDPAAMAEPSRSESAPLRERVLQDGPDSGRQHPALPRRPG
ncbi:hypothetical protein HPB47_009328, partial [Ixodes persulcatus]